MKHTRLYASLFAALLLASCIKNPSPASTADAPAVSTEEPAPATLDLIVDGTSAYTIVYAEKETYGFAAASALFRGIHEKTHVFLDILCDSEIPAEDGSPFEIIVGRVSTRSECLDIRCELKAGRFAIRVIGSRLYLLGRDEEGTKNAVTYFLEHFVPESKTLSLPIDLNFDSEKEVTPVLTWDGSQKTLFSGGYARMISLKNGNLMIAYSANGIQIRTSTDNGNTWSSPLCVTKSEKCPTGDKLNLENANVYEMEDGTLMAAYRAHSPLDTTNPFYTSIRYQLSRDGGKTWSERRILCEHTQTSGRRSGFWEPHMMTLPDGRLAIYYANDCVDSDTGSYPYVPSKSYQHIVMHIYDAATETFGEPIIASNGVDHNSRDGMPVVCRLSDGGCVMVIESNADKDYAFCIQMLFSEDGIHWGEPVTVVRPGTKKMYAGAPYVVLLPDGRLAVSCQATEFSGTTIGDSSTHNSVMNVYVSNDVITMANCGSVTKDSFTKVTPNPILPGTNGYSVWPAMVVHNGYLIVNADGGINKIEGGRSSLGLYMRRALLSSLAPINK